MSRLLAVRLQSGPGGEQDLYTRAHTHTQYEFPSKNNTQHIQHIRLLILEDVGYMDMVHQVSSPHESSHALTLFR